MDPLTRLLQRAAATAHHSLTEAVAGLLVKALPAAQSTADNGSILQLMAMADLQRMLSAVSVGTSVYLHAHHVHKALCMDLTRLVVQEVDSYAEFEEGMMTHHTWSHMVSYFKLIWIQFAEGCSSVVRVFDTCSLDCIIQCTACGYCTCTLTFACRRSKCSLEPWLVLLALPLPTQL